MAGDQTLDHLSRKEGAHIGMVKKRVERHAKAVGSVGASRYANAQKSLVGVRMTFGIELHGLAGKAQIAHPGVRRCRAVEKTVPFIFTIACENFGQPADVFEGVSLNRLAIGSGFRRTVQRQFYQADGKELHQLAGEILVRHPATAVGLAIAAHVQEIAHRRRERHLLEQGAEIAEGIGAHDIQIIADRKRRPGRIHTIDRDHQDLRQRKDHALAQLVGARQEGSPDGVVEGTRIEDQRGVVISLRFQPLHMARAKRHRKLFV